MTDEEKVTSSSGFTGTPMQLPVQDEDKDKDPFYTSEDPTAGTHEGWIKDPNIAQVIANAEKTQGRDVALKVEENERQKYEGQEYAGLEEWERFNKEAVETLIEIFPNAFEPAYDSTGKLYYVSGRSISALEGDRLLFDFLRYEHIREKLPQDIVSLFDKFRPLYKEFRVESERLLPLLHAADTGVYFSENGIQSFDKSKSSSNHPEASFYDPQSIVSTIRFQNLTKTEIDLLLKALSFIEKYVEAVEKMKNEPREGDNHSLPYIEKRARAIKEEF